ncbi:150_t:CDS:2 [Gigaspora rosea]|nr:150_t:CDS:2 [Gigaspora rosea]
MVHAMHKKTQIGCEEVVRDAVNTCPHSPLLLQITSTNPLESFHSELKAKISVQYGACQILLELDNKKMMAAKKTATEFRTKRISLTNVRPEVLNEIHKFPFPLQRLVAEEVHAVAKRLEEGKSLPNLASAECSCRFFNWYMLLCRHIFHEQLCGANILMPEAWENFQRTFEESGIEVYQTRGIVEISAVQIFAADKAAEKTRSKMNELFERTRDCYYRLAEKSENEPSQFVGNLEKILEPAIN